MKRNEMLDKLAALGYDRDELEGKADGCEKWSNNDLKNQIEYESQSKAERMSAGAHAAHETRARNGIALARYRNALGLDKGWNRWTAPASQYIAVRILEVCEAGDFKALAKALTEALAAKTEKTREKNVRKVESEWFDDQHDADARVYPTSEGDKPNPN